MKKIIFILTLSFITFGCTNDSHKEYSFTENTTIVLDDQEPNPFTRIVAGKNLVFKYYFQKEDDEQIADDEYSESIIFEINPELEHFSFKDNELTNIKAYFDKSCYCIIEGSTPIVKGTIQGNKVDDNTWNIQIDVSFTENNETNSKKLDGLFVKK